MNAEISFNGEISTRPSDVNFLIETKHTALYTRIVTDTALYTRIVTVLSSLTPCFAQVTPGVSP